MEREEKGTQVSSFAVDPVITMTTADERDTSLPARRARLRGLAQSKQPVDPSILAKKEDSDQASDAAPVIKSTDTSHPAKTEPASQTVVPGQALEILNNIDHAMEACAINLASLSKIAGDQNEALKTLANTLQNQTFSELGLNLSSLTESLSAALEPMKAVGELIPSLDELVSAIGTKDIYDQPAKLSVDDLLISLSDQLSNGLIDSWTFKCACLAIDSKEQPADLLHRLVDLLSAQRLSGEVFRTAYDAIQEAEPDALKHAMSKKNYMTEAQIEERAGVTAQTAKEQTLDKDNFPEDEQSKKLPSKSELSLDQLEELNKRYEELNDAFVRHERVLAERETELAQRQQELLQKDSENKQLKAQMEELIELVKESQKQATDTKAEIKKEAIEATLIVPESKPSPSFFDLDPANQASSLFDTTKQSAPLFDEKTHNEEDETLSLDKRTKANSAQTPAAAPETGQQAPKNVNKPQAASANSPFVSGAGSYGSGVRAQVFEVIVRQALAGAEWREICAGPMQVNNISPEEVESEVKRRQALLKK